MGYDINETMKIRDREIKIERERGNIRPFTNLAYHFQKETSYKTSRDVLYVQISPIKERNICGSLN